MTMKITKSKFICKTGQYNKVTMKKQSFFKNSNQKLFYNNNGTLITVTERNCKRLFLYLWYNWNGFKDEYSRINAKIPAYKREPIKRFLGNDVFLKISEGLPNAGKCIDIVLGTNKKPIIQIINKDEK